MFVPEGKFTEIEIVINHLNHTEVYQSFDEVNMEAGVGFPSPHGVLRIEVDAAGAESLINNKGLLALFKDFVKKMETKLYLKEKEGWSGWSSKVKMEGFRGGLILRMLHNIVQRHWVDVANLAMFAWNLDYGKPYRERGKK